MNEDWSDSGRINNFIWIVTKFSCLGCVNCHSSFPSRCQVGRELPERKREICAAMTRFSTVRSGTSRGILKRSWPPASVSKYSIVITFYLPGELCKTRGFTSTVQRIAARYALSPGTRIRARDRPRALAEGRAVAPSACYLNTLLTGEVWKRS